MANRASSCRVRNNLTSLHVLWVLTAFGAWLLPELPCSGSQADCFPGCGVLGQSSDHDHANTSHHITSHHITSHHITSHHITSSHHSAGNFVKMQRPTLRPSGHEALQALLLANGQAFAYVAAAEQSTSLGLLKPSSAMFPKQANEIYASQFRVFLTRHLPRTRLFRLEGRRPSFGMLHIVEQWCRCGEIREVSCPLTRPGK